MRAGPKREVNAGPLDLSRLPAGGSERVVAFVEEFLRVPKGAGALKPVRLRPWQRDLIAGMYDAPRPRQGLLSILADDPLLDGRTTAPTRQAVPA